MLLILTVAYPAFAFPLSDREKKCMHHRPQRQKSAELAFA